MNNVTLTGRLTKDPLKREKYSYFRVAVNRGEFVDFVPVIAFSRLGEVVAQYLTKGRLVSVEGRVTSSKNGAIVIANKVQFLDHPRPAATTKPAKPATAKKSKKQAQITEPF